MGIDQQETPKQQIRKLLTVFFAGMACALFFAVYMVYSYGPTGRYYVKNALISPQILENLSYNDRNSKTGGTSLFVLEDIVYSYYDKKTQQWQKISIDHESYTQFYNKVSNEKSLAEVPEDIVSLFNRAQPSSIALNVQTESQASWQKVSKIFQEVQFANQGDYFRIKLHEQNPQNPWVYFHHPKIDEEVFNIMMKKS